MTEEEAKTKWCPMVRRVSQAMSSGGVSVLAANRNGNGDIAAGSECIGSACMMFRWTLRSDSERSDEHGYCGLAGKP